jgi:hypothetical protein
VAVGSHDDYVPGVELRLLVEGHLAILIKDHHLTTTTM